MEQQLVSAQDYLCQKYDALSKAASDTASESSRWKFDPWINPREQKIPPCSVCETAFRNFKAAFPRPVNWTLDHKACCLWHDYIVARMLTVDPQLIIKHKSDDVSDRLRIIHAKLKGLPLN